MTCFVNSAPKFLPNLTTFPILNVPPLHQARTPIPIQTLETSQSHIIRSPTSPTLCSKLSPGPLTFSQPNPICSVWPQGLAQP